MSRLKQIEDWFEQRLQIASAIRETASHEVPRRSASWWYIFGSAAFTVFLLQIFTGIICGAYTAGDQTSWSHWY